MEKFTFSVKTEPWQRAGSVFQKRSIISHSDGSAATGWTEINGSWYYFFVNGVRVANRLIDGNYLA